MDNFNWVEAVGYLASVLTALGIMMKSITWLRVIHLMGCTAFTVYGFLLGANPIIVLNLFLVVVNAYHLVLLMKKKAS